MDNATTLRLIWPQYQGATRANAISLIPEVPAERARRGYAVGTRVLEEILPEHSGPTATVHVPDSEESATNGIESRDTLLQTLSDALSTINKHTFDRILTLGGDCSVSVAPFSALAEKYGDDLAVIWIDAHPDTDTPETDYEGFHAMAVSLIVGRGDEEFVGKLPATISPDRVAYAGIHDWEEDAYANVKDWGLTEFTPEDLRTSSDPLLAWLHGTGCSKIAVHFDVDVVDSDDMTLGLGAVPGGLTRAQVQRVIDDLEGAADVVGLTVAEFIPRSVLALADILENMPLTRR